MLRFPRGATSGFSMSGPARCPRVGPAAPVRDVDRYAPVKSSGANCSGRAYKADSNTAEGYTPAGKGGTDVRGGRGRSVVRGSAGAAVRGGGGAQARLPGVRGAGLADGTSLAHGVRP